MATIPPGSDDRDPDMLSIFLNGAHLARWRGNVLALLGDDEAVTSLYSALDVVDPSFVRAQAGLHADLLPAHLARAEYDDANTHLRQARLLASRTGWCGSAAASTFSVRGCKPRLAAARQDVELGHEGAGAH